MYTGTGARVHFELGGERDEIDPPTVHIDSRHDILLKHGDVTYVDQEYAAQHNFPLNFIDATTLSLPTLANEADAAGKAAKEKKKLPHGYEKVGFGKSKHVDLRIQRTIDDDDEDYDQIVNEATCKLLQLEHGQHVRSVSAMALGTTFQTPHQDFRPITVAREHNKRDMHINARPNITLPEHAVTRPGTIYNPYDPNDLRPPAPRHSAETWWRTRSQ